MKKLLFLSGMLLVSILLSCSKEKEEGKSSSTDKGVDLTGTQWHSDSFNHEEGEDYYILSFTSSSQVDGSSFLKRESAKWNGLYSVNEDEISITMSDNVIMKGVYTANTINLLVDEDESTYILYTKQ